MFFPQVVDYLQNTRSSSSSGMVRQLTSDRDGVTNDFILDIAKVTTNDENTKCSTPKICTLYLLLLLIFITFTIINVDKYLIFCRVGLGIVVVLELHTFNVYMVF